MKFGWCSDTHVGNTQYGLERRRLDFAQAFTSAVEDMLQRGLKLIVHTGDLLNSNRPGPDSIECLRRVHRMLVAHEARMIVISGNHDQTDPPWPTLLEPYDNMLGITVQDRQVFTYGDVRFFGVPSMPPEQFKKIQWPEADIMMCHMQVQEFIGFESLGAIAVADLPLGQYSAVLIGDIHIHKIETYVRAGRPSVIAGYTGSTELCSESEPSEKFWTEIEFTPGTTAKLTKHLIRTRQVFRRVVERTEDIEQHVKDITEMREQHQEQHNDDRAPIVFVEYPSDLPGVMERFRTAFNPDEWVIRFKPVLRQRASLGAPLPTHDQDLTPKDILRSCLAVRSDLLPVAELLITPTMDANATLDNYIETRLRDIEAASRSADRGTPAVS